ncbi:MAG: indole-3-glycerol phosphate synthase [Saprospiraceae bacterium]|jgi:indole-3-glycerol phosphate synthase|uniref:indole-3-glycerol phosphate synthase TrpC n=1 Tax=Patiriisocius sp. Uisw_047 TaxID=3230969 RepID=UPI0039EAF325
MTILKKITEYKKLEVAARMQAFPLSVLKQSTLFARDCFSMAKSVAEGSGIIAEHKRRSPSKSVINENILVPEVVKGYEKAGVSAISVLTDTKFFGGSLDDLLVARACVNIPLLRKEFIIDPYQIYEAKAYGADAILLIAACLEAGELQEYSALAKELGMDVLLEIHNEEELKKSLHPTVDLLGVNNRNLKTFEVSLDASKALSKLIPDSYVKVSESGISTIEAIQELKPYGYKGFLIGERFMKTEDPGKSAMEFIKALQ